MTNTDLREKAVSLAQLLHVRGFDATPLDILSIETALVSARNDGVEACAAQLDAVAEVLARNGMAEGAGALIEQAKVLRGPTFTLPGAP